MLHSKLPFRTAACLTSIVLSSLLAVAGVAVAADGAAEPTVTELLERIEALEKALAEVKEQCSGAAATAAQAPCDAAAGTAVPTAAQRGGATARPGSATARGDACTAADEASVVGRTGARAEDAAEPSGRIRAVRKVAPAVAADTAPPSDAAADPAPVDDDERRADGRVQALAGPVPDDPAAFAGDSGARALAGYRNGFFVRTADGDYRLRMNGYVQADSRWFADDATADDTDAFLIRRARIEFRADLFDRFELRLEPDFAGGSLTIPEASIEVDFARWLDVRAGKLRTPFGIERLQGASDLPFLERALTDNLIPGRDVGVRARGTVLGGGLEYALAVLNGVADGTNDDEDFNDGVDVVARLFATPWAPHMYSPLRGLGFGAAGTWGRDQGDPDDEDRLPSYETSGDRDFFRWDGDSYADGDHYRVSPQMSWFEGPVGLLGEYVLSSQQVANDDVDERGRVSNQAWQVRTTWMLTGERATMEDVVPNAPFDFGGGDWGAFELALRWSSLDVDPEVFEKEFANPERSARHADALGMAINWYLNRHVALYLNYERTMFGGGAEDGDRPSEDAVLTRLQLKF